MTEVQAEPAQNGSAPLVPHAAEIVQQLRSLIGERELRLAELDREREQIQKELKTYEAAIRPLTGEIRLKKRGRPAKTAEPARSKESNFSPERLEAIKEVILAYAADHEEFRQVDVRSAHATLPDGGKLTSGMTARAFEILRQEPHNLLRIARVEGNSKFYRLTRQAMRA
jgi:hypothetical protein